VIYGTERYASCNPGQMYPVGTGSIEITITHRSSWHKSNKTLQVVQNLITTSSSSPATTTPPPPPTKDTTPPIAIIEFDGRLYDYYQQINDYEFNCYTMTCSVNLDGDRSYDPEGGKVRFLWIYGPNEIKTSRDPGGRKYGIWDHEIVMRVIDESENYSQIRYRIHVLGPRTDIEKEKKMKKKETKTNDGSGELELEKEIQNQIKIPEVSFFDPPEILLQDSKFVPDGDGYICRTKNKTCSINLVLSGTQNDIVYSWDYGDGDILISKNPRSHSYDAWDHVIRLTAGYDIDTPIWSRDMSISVEKIASVKKSKKHKWKTTESGFLPTQEWQKWEKNAGTSFQKSVSAESTETDVPYTTMVFVASVVPLVLVRRYFIGA
jgi:hypothetical protein